MNVRLGWRIRDCVCMADRADSYNYLTPTFCFFFFFFFNFNKELIFDLQWNYLPHFRSKTFHRMASTGITSNEICL